MKETIAKLVQYVSIFSVKENGSKVHHYFEEHTDAASVVVIEGKKPMGLITRNDFYQKIGRKFGFSLYMNRDISFVMKSNIVCVDINLDMTQFGYIAMERSTDSMYDDIIVLQDDEYVGVVSISNFLIEMSKTKEREIELLNTQQKILKESHEAEKAHRQEIQQKNSAIKNLLDNAGQGFLFFKRDLLISDEYSKECIEIFGCKIGNISILEVLEKHVDGDTLGLFKKTFQQIFNESSKSRSKIYLSILPKELKIGCVYTKIQYKVIGGPQEKSIMIILTDITDKKALEKSFQEEKNNMKLIISTISNKSEIIHTLEYAKDLFKNKIPSFIDTDQELSIKIKGLFRLIHTMKGDFSLYSFHFTAKNLHRLEDRLSLMIKNLESIDLTEVKSFIKDIKFEEVVSQDIQTVKNILGDNYLNKEELIMISNERFEMIKEKIALYYKGEEKADVLQILNQLKYSNIKSILDSYNNYAKAIAEGLGKRLYDINISGDNVYLDKEHYLGFSKSLVHIFRNIVEHGIEEGDERINVGKPRYGKIICEIKKESDMCRLTIRDDGRGINSNIIAEKAVNKGLLTPKDLEAMTEEERLQIIFSDDFSTKDNVTMLSGRGVGLASVLEEVGNLGGLVRVSTALGEYTEFEFIFPVI